MARHACPGDCRLRCRRQLGPAHPGPGPAAQERGLDIEFLHDGHQLDHQVRHDPDHDFSHVDHSGHLHHHGGQRGRCARLGHHSDPGLADASVVRLGRFRAELELPGQRHHGDCERLRHRAGGRLGQPAPPV
jgi:hypothetical protein